MTVPIDLTRWRQRLTEVREALPQVDAGRDALWPDIRSGYRLCLVVYDMMGVDQQREVQAELEAVRVELERRAHCG